MRPFTRVPWMLVLSLTLVSGMAWPVGATSCVADGAPGDVLVVRFAPALDPGSADLIDLLVSGPLQDLCGVEVTDGEGTVRFQRLPVAPGDVIRLVSAPDLVLPDDPRVRAVLVLGDSPFLSDPQRFALAKGGDGITVTADATVLDQVAYGSENVTRTGWSAWSGGTVDATRIERRVFLRAADATGPVDTGSAADWTFPRVYRQHQVDRPTAWSTADEVRAFLCPDRCFEEVVACVEDATRSIDLNLYDLSAREAIEPVAAAAERGVAVRVLLHDRPVGASAAAMDRIAWGVDRLRAAGADVRTMDGLRFDVNHAKYLVVDGTWTVVLSENANAHGWPMDGYDGNRGWGVAVRDAEVAAWMTALFESDFLHPADARPIQGADLHPDLQPPAWGAQRPPAGGRVPTLVVTDVRVMPVVAPDHFGDPGSSPLVAALAAARTSIAFQQLNLPLDWSRPGYRADSPLVAAMGDAVARGVAVRGVLAAAFQDGNVSTPGNDRTAAVLSDAWPSAAVHLGSAPSGGLVHNKGWIVDAAAGGRNLVVVGSANGNLASQAMNREVTVFIEDARVAAYYAEAFAADLARAAGPASGPEGAVGALPAAGFVGVFAVVAVALVLRRSVDMASRRGPWRRA